MQQLTDDDQAILDFESQWWRYAGAKETAIVETFGHLAEGVSAVVRYYATLNALIERPEALAYAPLLVKRLVRLRDQRRGQRSARRLYAGTAASDSR